MELRVAARLLTLLSVLVAASAATKGDASTIDLLRRELLGLEHDLENDLAEPKWANVELQQKYLHVVRTYKKIDDRLDEAFSPYQKIHLRPLESLWIWTYIQTDCKVIDDLYMVFRQLQSEILEAGASVNAKPLMNFVEKMMRDSHSVPWAHNRIAHFIVENKLLIGTFQDASHQICDEVQSPQQLLYNLYNAVALTEIKGYTMIQFSYMILRLYNEGSNFSEEMQALKQQYANRMSETLRAVKTAMAFASREIWKCDASKPELDETYTELRQLFQGYIVNEVDLNNYGTCKENCAYYSTGYSKVYDCYMNQFCAQQRRCNGKVLNCEYIDSDMWICPSHLSSDRRYEYIQYKNGLVYGNKGSCPRGTTKVNSWWRYLFWHCSYCFCYCDDNSSNTDRYFSLRTAMSDTSNNKVITGIKLAKVNRVIHIQIQEGQLLPRGAINASTVSWEPIDAFSVFDINSQEGVDYHKLVWEKRALDLDDLLPPQDHLLTGVRFRLVGTRLNLEMMATPFNFTSGLLIQPERKSFWHSNDITDRTELTLSEPDIPTRDSSTQNVPDSRPNQYLNFAPSDRRKDVAQSTVPFLDVQPIVPDPAVPIAGVGIFHKGRKGSGGFVALKLITYDFTPHLQVDLPPAPPVLETPNEITTA